MADVLKNAELMLKVEIEKELAERAKEYHDKHWDECRQIALYQDERNKAMKLLDKVSDIHYAAIRGSANEVSLLTGKLMHEIRELEIEIAVNERGLNNG